MLRPRLKYDTELYEGRSESKERFAIQRYLLYIILYIYYTQIFIIYYIYYNFTVMNLNL